LGLACLQRQWSKASLMMIAVGEGTIAGRSRSKWSRSNIIARKYSVKARAAEYS
jgi:hypothetical protein